jgi:hypothetical protein
MSNITFSNWFKLSSILGVLIFSGLIESILLIGIAPFASLFYVHVFMIIFGLAFATKLSYDWMADVKTNYLEALENTFYLSIWLCACCSFSGVVFTVTAAAAEYLRRQKVKDNKLYELWGCYTLYLLGLKFFIGLSAIFFPGIAVLFLENLWLAEILDWVVDLVCLYKVYDLMGFVDFQQVISWGKSHEKTIRLSLAAIGVFLLTSPALYVLVNYVAFFSALKVSFIFYQLLFAACLYLVQPLVEEIITRTGLLAFLSYSGFTGPSKNNSLFKKLLHYSLLVLLMGFVFGYMHSSVVGAAIFGISALLFHTISGIVYSAVSIWSEGIEQSTVLHGLHNYSVEIYSYSIYFGANAFNSSKLYLVTLTRAFLCYLSIKIIDYTMQPEESEALAVVKQDLTQEKKKMNEGYTISSSPLQLKLLLAFV